MTAYWSVAPTWSVTQTPAVLKGRTPVSVAKEPVPARSGCALLQPLQPVLMEIAPKTKQNQSAVLKSSAVMKHISSDTRHIKKKLLCIRPVDLECSWHIVFPNLYSVGNLLVETFTLQRKLINKLFCKLTWKHWIYGAISRDNALCC